MILLYFDEGFQHLPQPRFLGLFEKTAVKMDGTLLPLVRLSQVLFVGGRALAGFEKLLRFFDVEHFADHRSMFRLEPGQGREKGLPHDAVGHLGSAAIKSTVAHLEVQCFFQIFTAAVRQFAKNLGLIIFSPDDQLLMGSAGRAVGRSVCPDIRIAADQTLEDIHKFPLLMLSQKSIKVDG